MSLYVENKVKVSKDGMLDDIHIHEFQKILERESKLILSMQSTLLLQTPDLIKAIKVGEKHIQILFNGSKTAGHWICSYYDGQMVYIYDSLNTGRLNQDQFSYLSRLYPFKPPVVFATVQQQPYGSNDCGVFSIAFATSIFFNELPNTLDYVIVNENSISDIQENEMRKMRKNVNSMFKESRLFPFERKQSCDVRYYIVEYDWKRLLIDRSYELSNGIMKSPSVSEFFTLNSPCKKLKLEYDMKKGQQKLFFENVNNKSHESNQEGFLSTSDIHFTNDISSSKSQIQTRNLKLNSKEKKVNQQSLTENVYNNNYGSPRYLKASSVNNDIGELKLKTQYARQKRYRENKKMKEKLCNENYKSSKEICATNDNPLKSVQEETTILDNKTFNLNQTDVLSSSDIQCANDIPIAESQIQKKRIKLNNEKKKVDQQSLIENVDNISYRSPRCSERTTVNNDLGELKLKTQYARIKRYRENKKIKEKLCIENYKISKEICATYDNPIKSLQEVITIIDNKTFNLNQTDFFSSSDIQCTNDIAGSKNHIQKKIMKVNSEEKKVDQESLVDNVDNISHGSPKFSKVSLVNKDLGGLTLMTPYARLKRYRENKKQNKMLDFDNHEDSENYLGRMDYVCQHCDAKHFHKEQIWGKKNSYNDCCSHGGVRLQTKEYPYELRVLLDGSHPKSAHFMQCVRCYNTSFASASFNANIVDFKERRRGPYCFKIQGQIYYQMNSALYPENGVDPCFGQLFIYDADDAVQFRLNYNEKLDTEILYSIENVMRTNNAFTKSFMMMKEVIDMETELARANDEQVPELKLLFTLKKGMDRNRYNFQGVNEVAAIFNTNSEGEVPECYVTVHNYITNYSW